jgi:hypothetical protein
VSNLRPYFSHAVAIAKTGRESIKENCTWLDATFTPAFMISIVLSVSKLHKPTVLARLSAAMNSSAWMYCLSLYYSCDLRKHALI